MVEIVKEQTLFRQSELFVEVLINLQRKKSKGSERKRKELVRMVIWTTDKWNVCLENVLDVDMKIS